MGFFDAIKLGFQRYVTFEGRSARWEYWYWVLFNLVAGAVLGAISENLGGAFSLAVLLPGLAVTARRLHDIDRSGWWMLIAIVPLIGWLVMLYWTVQRGTVGANRFGPDPLAGALPAA